MFGGLGSTDSNMNIDFPVVGSKRRRAFLRTVAGLRGHRNKPRTAKCGPWPERTRSGQFCFVEAVFVKELPARPPTRNGLSGYRALTRYEDRL